MHRRAAIAAALVLLVAMISLSRDFGFTWDERFQQRYGEQIWDYLHGGLPRAVFDTDEGNQYLYGGLVEIAAVAAQHVVPAETYIVRHAVNAVFRLGRYRHLRGYCRTGLRAPRRMDRRGVVDPGAALLRRCDEQLEGPAIRGDVDGRPWTHADPRLGPPSPGVAARGLAGACSLRWRSTSVRLGLVLYLYAAGVIGLGSLASAVLGADEERWSRFGWNLGRLLAIAVVSVPAGSVFWPYAQAQPYTRPLGAFVKTTQLDWARGFDVLFGGQNLGAGALPWLYVPTWLVMSLPPVILVGFALSWLIARRGTQQAVAWAGLFAFAAVPVAAAIVRHATIYDGIRHLLFVVSADRRAGWRRMERAARHAGASGLLPRC
jgi:hypothetical protein